MKKRLVSILLSTAMVAAALSGCGGSGETATTTETKTETAEIKTEAKTDTAANAAASDSTYTGELEIMHYSTSEESQGNGGSDGFRTVLAEWNEAHPDIELVENVLANAEYKTQIATLAAASS